MAVTSEQLQEQMHELSTNVTRLSAEISVIYKACPYREDIRNGVTAKQISATLAGNMGDLKTQIAVMAAGAATRAGAKAGLLGGGSATIIGVLAYLLGKSQGLW